MKLREAIQKIQYDSNWEIWAEIPFQPNSEARYGQQQFKHGGILDHKEFFANGMACGDFIANYSPDGDYHDEAARMMIDDIEKERRQEQEQK